MGIGEARKEARLKSKNLVTSRFYPNIVSFASISPRVRAHHGIVNACAITTTTNSTPSQHPSSCKNFDLCETGQALKNGPGAISPSLQSLSGVATHLVVDCPCDDHQHTHSHRVEKNVEFENNVYPRGIDASPLSRTSLCESTAAILILARN